MYPAPRVKMRPTDAVEPPPRPSSLRTNAPPSAVVARRPVLTARPDGRIIWQPWNQRQDALTELAIKKAVASAPTWKRR